MSDFNNAMSAIENGMSANAQAAVGAQRHVWAEGGAKQAVQHQRTEGEVLGPQGQQGGCVSVSLTLRFFVQLFAGTHLMCTGSHRNSFYLKEMGRKP